MGASPLAAAYRSPSVATARISMEQLRMSSIEAHGAPTMKKPFELFAGIIAALAVMLTVTLYLTTDQQTKKTASKYVPHGQNETPVAK